MTFGQETERVYSYNSEARTGPAALAGLCTFVSAILIPHFSVSLRSCFLEFMITWCCLRACVKKLMWNIS